MRSTIDLIITTLRAGMTTDLDEASDFWVKEWYTGDPLGVPMITTPAGAVIPEVPSSRLIEFVGLDTITDTVAIRFYQLADQPVGEAPEVTKGLTKLLSMLEIAQQLLRVDPTFGSQFVMSEIRDVNAQLPGIPGQNVYRIAQIRFECKRRALWGT